MDFLSIGATAVVGHVLSQVLGGTKPEATASPPTPQTSRQGGPQVFEEEDFLEAHELLPQAQARTMIGPFALDAHMPADLEMEFWKAYNDTREGADMALLEYSNQFLSGFDGEFVPFPYAAGILAHRSLEIRRVLEAAMIQAEHFEARQSLLEKAETPKTPETPQAPESEPTEPATPKAKKSSRAPKKVKKSTGAGGGSSPPP